MIVADVGMFFLANLIAASINWTQQHFPNFYELLMTSSGTVLDTQTSYYCADKKYIFRVLFSFSTVMIIF